MNTAWSPASNSEQLGRWIARAWAGVLLLFWGSFFVAHTIEWFIHPGAFPPPHVWTLHFAHLMLLVGLVLGWRWELVGGLVTVVSAVLFFGFVGGPRVVTFIAISIAPAIVWIALGLKSRRQLA